MQETPDITNANESPEAGSSPSAEGDLEERLKKAEEAAKSHQEAWLRSRAEAENVRKRTQTEISNAHKFAVENFASELLPVKDSLEAALASANTSAENMRAGVELTLRQLNSVFEKFNITEVDPTGQKFDPHRHQAISTVESDAEPNTVVQTLQKGYLLHDRVIRPALVIVAKPRGES
jgi:molecular chaperone GrpE